jgi:hypothetical protein
VVQVVSTLGALLWRSKALISDISEFPVVDVLDLKFLVFDPRRDFWTGTLDTSLYPVFFSRAWLWLYAASGIYNKARRE